MNTYLLFLERHVKSSNNASVRLLLTKNPACSFSYPSEYLLIVFFKQNSYYNAKYLLPCTFVINKYLNTYVK